MYREKSEREKGENLVFEAFLRGRYGGGGAGCAPPPQDPLRNIPTISV